VPAEAPVAPGRHGSPGASGRSNRAVAAIILIVMGAFFLAGLGYALWTKSFREKNHPKSTGGALATARNPFDLPGLGYLPAETNLVAAFRPADLLDDSLGQRLLAVPRPRLLDLALTNVEKWTAQPATNIDHVVVGAAITRADRIPPLVFVVQNREPYHPQVLANKLKTKAVDHQDRPLFRFRFDPAGEGYLWCMNPRVMVLVVRIIEGVKLEDLDTIPRDPWAGAAGLPAPLRELIIRMDKESLAWIAGHIADPAMLENVLGLLQKGGESQARMLTKIDSFGLWLVPEEKTLRLGGDLRGRDEQSRGQVAALLTDLIAPDIELKIAEPIPTTPAADRLWLQFQMRASAARLREILQR
jgi:hypothetical protein